MCLSAWDDKDEVLVDIDRWLPTTEADTLPDSTPDDVAREYPRLRPQLYQAKSVSTLWAASYNAQVNNALSSESKVVMSKGTSSSTGAAPGTESLFIAFSIGIRHLQNTHPAKYSFWISAEKVRRSHRVIEAKYNTANRELSWSLNNKFQSFSDVLAELYQTAKIGDHQISVFRALVSKVGDLETGCVKCASVSRFQRLAELKGPTKLFANYATKLLSDFKHKIPKHGAAADGSAASCNEADVCQQASASNDSNDQHDDQVLGLHAALDQSAEDNDDNDDAVTGLQANDDEHDLETHDEAVLGLLTRESNIDSELKELQEQLQEPETDVIEQQEIASLRARSEDGKLEMLAHQYEETGLLGMCELIYMCSSFCMCCLPRVHLMKL